MFVFMLGYLEVAVDMKIEVLIVIYMFSYACMLNFSGLVW